MSAYIVDDERIDLLLTYIKDNSGECYGIGEAVNYRNENLYRNDKPIKKQLTDIGQYLIDYNYKSVNDRYRDEHGKSHKYKFKEYKKEITLGQFLKACDNLDYQCSEPNDYHTDETSAYWMIAHFLKFGYRRVETYEVAQW